MAFYLNIQCADQPAVRCRLEEGRLVLGSSSAADLQLQHYFISRRHSLVHVGTSQVAIEDLGSTNGTYLNGQLLAPNQLALLTPQDHVQIGPFRLRLETLAPDQTLESLPPAQAAEMQWGLEAEGSPRIMIEGPMLVGSDATSGICLRQAGVAPQHAYVQPRGEVLSVEAIGEAELWQGSQRVRSLALREGEQVGLGPNVRLTARRCGVVRAGARAVQPLNLGLVKKSEILIGRAPECDVRLEHPLVSRHHARLRQRHAGWVVEDLGSVHGTFIDGQRLSSPAVIHEGQTLEVAGYRFTIASFGLRPSSAAGVRRIDAQHVTQRVRGGKPILRDVSLHIEAGELVALVGGSGAGKSTLLNALSGFAPAAEGAVLFNGRDLYDHYDLFRSQIGYVPQQDILHEALPLERALLYSSRLRLSERGRTEAHLKGVDLVLAQLGLARQRRRLISTLSGGERKRANLAAELITAPSVLFLDEPTSGLDPLAEEDLMGQLRELADSGKTVVVVTHVAQNLTLCDKVAFIGTGGYLVYFGTPEDALEYFEVKTFLQIYRRLTREQPPAWWAKRYQASDAYRRYVESPRASHDGPPTSPTARRRLRVKRTPRWRQLTVLVRRYGELIGRDWRNLVLMLLQAPAIAALMGLGFTRSAFSTDPARGDAGDAVTMLFFMAVVAVWFGIFNSTREIVKELPIYQRERMSSIDVLPYLLSKILVLAAIGAIQVAGFLVVAALLIELPTPEWELVLKWFVTLLSGSLLGTGMGLLVSALVVKQDWANTAIIFLLIPQLILAGAFTPVSKMDPASNLLSTFVAARWTFETLGAQAGILDIVEKLRGGVSDSLRATFDVNVSSHLGVMAAGLGLLLMGCYAALRRKDPL